ncbi:hypothetical protein M885DRAFT_250443 [Pelagophyceae sp. CCMP2097]|nr:hypothetical protein M885DRAFT_250443 [Pelagophyceae sp. CCMP2097]
MASRLLWLVVFSGRVSGMVRQLKAIGPSRRPAWLILEASTDAKSVRRAETAWRQTWQLDKTKPEAAEVRAVVGALGAIRDGVRLEALLRLLAKPTFRRHDVELRLNSTAVCALALCGLKNESIALLAHSPEASPLALALAGDAARAAREGAATVSAALGTESLRQAVLVLLRMQRVGFLDFHGIVAQDATLALRILVEDSAHQRLVRDRGLDGLVVVTGKGKHSPNGVSTASGPRLHDDSASRRRPVVGPLRSRGLFQSARHRLRAALAGERRRLHARRRPGAATIRRRRRAGRCGVVTSEL